MFLYSLIDISVLMPIGSTVLWLCFASMCRKAVKGATTGTLGRAEAETQPVSCSAALAATTSSSCLGDVTAGVKQQDCSAQGVKEMWHWSSSWSWEGAVTLQGLGGQSLLWGLMHWKHLHRFCLLCSVPGFICSGLSFLHHFLISHGGQVWRGHSVLFSAVLQTAKGSSARDTGCASFLQTHQQQAKSEDIFCLLLQHQ